MRLQKYDFNDDVTEEIKKSGHIPIDFYNSQGQKIIERKEHASPHEIQRFSNFIMRGVYFREEDMELLKKKKRKENAPDGFTNTKLITKQLTENLGHEVSNVFDELRTTTFNSVHSNAIRNQVNTFVDEFRSQPEVMQGMINISDLLGQLKFGNDVKVAMKRAVVALSLKTRGMDKSGRSRASNLQSVGELMVASLLAQIGKGRIKLPESFGLEIKDREQVQKYPLFSYLTVAHESSLSTNTKHFILTHRRPMGGDKGLNNNYPGKKWLLLTLKNMAEKMAEQGKVEIARDMSNQLRLFFQSSMSTVDSAIISLATDFASLTADTGWRVAFEPLKATEIILNESIYSYPPALVREFLDYVAISLAGNEKLIKEQNFVIVKESSADDERYEVAMIARENLHQSRPVINRVASVSIKPSRRKDGKILPYIIPQSLKPEPRHVKVDLSRDISRDIVYYVTHENQPELMQRILKL